jgi:hypothetical protein
VIEGGVGKIVIERDAVPVPAGLEALIVVSNTPVTVGIPLIIPLLVFTLRPEGSPVAP